jgi:hypothetical protein
MHIECCCELYLFLNENETNIPMSNFLVSEDLFGISCLDVDDFLKEKVMKINDVNILHSLLECSIRTEKLE